MAAPNLTDLRILARGAMIATRPDLTLEDGSIADMIADMAAAMADVAIGTAAEDIRDTYLDGASGDALNALTDDHWDNPREGAVAATGEITLTRTGNGAGDSGTILAGTRVATDKAPDGSEVVYATDDDVVAPVSGALTFTVDVTAQDAGIDGNVSETEITRILDVPAFGTWSVSNADKITGGSDAQSDDDLRDETRGISKTLRRATLDAIEFGAKQVPGVARATVSESSAGVVTVYVSDIDGNSNSSMSSDVDTELDNWRAAGVVLNVVGGVVVEQAVDVTLLLKTGSNAAALADLVREAIVAQVTKLKIYSGSVDDGSVLYQQDIQRAVLNVDPNIVKVTVNTPATDVIPGSVGQIIRTTTSLVTVS